MESLQKTYEGWTILGDEAREVNEGLLDHEETTHRPSKHVRPSQDCQASQDGRAVCHVRQRGVIALITPPRTYRHRRRETEADGRMGC